LRYQVRRQQRKEKFGCKELGDVRRGIRRDKSQDVITQIVGEGLAGGKTKKLGWNCALETGGGEASVLRGGGEW